MLDARGFVKLVDFGLAKENVQLAFDDPVSPCGSAMYVAPEVLGFQGGFMIDWWSLGVLVYELLTGSPPWNTKVRRLIGKIYQWNSSGKRIEMLPPFTNLTGLTLNQNSS